MIEMAKAYNRSLYEYLVYLLENGLRRSLFLGKRDAIVVKHLDEESIACVVNFEGRRIIRMEYYKRSYSQQGEDMIVDFIFNAKGIQKPTYLDIGANDPCYISNTAFFYEKGCRGINIEPNPQLFERIKNIREEDINLNIGLGEKDAEIDFYVLNNNTMSTFSKENADKLCKDYSFRIENVIKIDVKNVNYVSDVYCNGAYPDFVSIDTEGLDIEILKSFDYKRKGANVICCETIEYSEDFNGKKEKQIIDFMESQGYVVYADTYINTIFCRKRWLDSHN